MSSVAKPQRKFMFILLTALTYLPGRVNFRNLGRYIPLSEKTFSRWFRRPFNFVAFNLLSLNALLDNDEWVAAIDASFSPKSGRRSYGLDWFGNGSRGQAERGLERSLLALVDVTRNTAYTLSAYQTPALPKAPKASKVPKDTPKKEKAKAAKVTTSNPKPMIIKRLKSPVPLESIVTLLISNVIPSPCWEKSVIWSLTVFTPRPSLLMGCENMACTVSVSYGMMPACAGYTTVNEKPKAGLASTRARSVLMICHALNWPGTSMDSAFTPLSSMLPHSTVCCASSTSYGKKKATSIRHCCSAPTLTVRRWTSCAITRQGFRLSSCSAMPSNTLACAIARRLPKKSWGSISMFHWQQAVEGAGRNVISIASWETRKFNAHLLEKFSCHLALDFTAIKSSTPFAALCSYGAIAA
jgi:hypothetical protein